MKLIIPPPIVGLATAAAMWVVARYVGFGSFLFPGQKLFAAVFAAAGVAIDAISILAFVRARTTVTPLSPEKASVLVIRGFYKISRNPMYLGMLLLLIGWGIWLGSVLSLSLTLLFVAYLTAFQIRPEEAALRQKFGQQYVEYCRQVRRWF